MTSGHHHEEVKWSDDHYIAAAKHQLKQILNNRSKSKSKKVSNKIDLSPNKRAAD